MSLQLPTPKWPDGVSGGLVVFLLAAFTLALFLAWRWFPVSIAVSPSSARSAKDVDAIAARLTPPRGYTVNAYATGLGGATVMVLTPKGDIIVSSPPHRVLLVKADNDGDGRSDGVETLIDELENPSGLFLDGDQLYIAKIHACLESALMPRPAKSSEHPKRSSPTSRATVCIGRARSRKARMASSM